MIANFVVKTKTEYFSETTVGGAWQWKLHNTTTDTMVRLWGTTGPAASEEVIEGDSYTIACTRTEQRGGHIGPEVSTRFTATITVPPVGTAIEVADSMIVSLQ